MSIVRDISIPKELEDVSPEWLSAALAKAHPGVQVTSVRPESLHQGTASTWRLNLEYAPGKSSGPGTVCIKSDYRLPHKDRIASSGLYRKEASVYLDVLPATSARVVVCYAANYDDAGRGFMLMQDVKATGGDFCNPVSPLTIDQVAIGVEQLAELHGATWNRPVVQEPQWLHHGRPLTEEDPLWNGLFAQYAELLKGPHAGAMARVFHDPQVVKTAFNRLRGLDAPIARSLIHGDAHVGNFFADENGAPGMADFQCVQRGHVTHDLSMFIGSALDVAERRSHERDLLQHYLEHLEGVGVTLPAFDEIWLGYRRHYLYSMFVWLSTPVGIQPALHLVTNVFRYGQAALDLDSLGAIQ